MPLLVSTPTRVRLLSLSEASLVLTYDVRVPSSMFCPMVSPVIAWQPVMKKRTTNVTANILNVRIINISSLVLKCLFSRLARIVILRQLISFPLPGPPVCSRVTPVAVRSSIPSAIVPVIAAPDPVVSAVIATAIPLVTSTRNQHEAGRYNSVHDHSECVHKTLLKNRSFIIFIYSDPLYFRGRARDRYRSCRESPASIAWRPYPRSPIGRSGILGRDKAHVRQRYNRPPGCGCRSAANESAETKYLFGQSLRRARLDPIEA